MKVVIVADLAIDAEFVRDALDPDPTPGTPAAVPCRVGPDAGLRRTRSGTAQGLRGPLAAQCDGARSRRLGPHRAPTSATVGDSSSAWAIDVFPTTMPARPSRSSCRQRRARRQAPRRSSASAGSTTPPTRSSAAIPRSSTRCWRRCPSTTTGRSQPHQGDAHALGLPRQRPRAARADDPRAPDRPCPALDHPPGTRVPTVGSNAAWNELPQVWSFYYLMTQTVPYLAGTSSERLIYEAGQDVMLADRPDSAASRTTSFKDPTRGSVRPAQPAADERRTLDRSPRSRSAQWTVAASAD